MRKDEKILAKDVSRTLADIGLNASRIGVAVDTLRTSMEAAYVRKRNKNVARISQKILGVIDEEILNDADPFDLLCALLTHLIWLDSMLVITNPIYKEASSGFENFVGEIQASIASAEQREKKYDPSVC